MNWNGTPYRPQAGTIIRSPLTYCHTLYLERSALGRWFWVLVDGFGNLRDASRNSQLVPDMARKDFFDSYPELDAIDTDEVMAIGEDQ